MDIDKAVQKARSRMILVNNAASPDEWDEAVKLGKQLGSDASHMIPLVAQFTPEHQRDFVPSAVDKLDPMSAAVVNSLPNETIAHLNYSPYTVGLASEYGKFAKYYNEVKSPQTGIVFPEDMNKVYTQFNPRFLQESITEYLEATGQMDKNAHSDLQTQIFWQMIDKAKDWTKEDENLVRAYTARFLNGESPEQLNKEMQESAVNGLVMRNVNDNMQEVYKLGNLIFALACENFGEEKVRSAPLEERKQLFGAIQSKYRNIRGMSQVPLDFFDDQTFSDVKKEMWMDWFGQESINNAVIASRNSKMLEGEKPLVTTPEQTIQRTLALRDSLNAYRDTSWGYDVHNALANSVSFMAGTAITGGLSNIAKGGFKEVVKNIGKAALKNAYNPAIIARSLSGAGAETITELAEGIDPIVIPLADGKSYTMTQEDTRNALDIFAKALVKQGVINATEATVESVGGLLPQIPIPQKLANSMLQKIMSKHGADAVRRIMQSGKVLSDITNFQSFFQEVGEELIENIALSGMDLIYETVGMDFMKSNEEFFLKNPGEFFSTVLPTVAIMGGAMHSPVVASSVWQAMNSRADMNVIMNDLGMDESFNKPQAESNENRNEADGNAQTALRDAIASRHTLVVSPAAYQAIVDSVDETEVPNGRQKLTEIAKHDNTNNLVLIPGANLSHLYRDNPKLHEACKKIVASHTSVLPSIQDSAVVSRMAQAVNQQQQALIEIGDSVMSALSSLPAGEEITKQVAAVDRVAITQMIVNTANVLLGEDFALLHDEQRAKRVDDVKKMIGGLTIAYAGNSNAPLPANQTMGIKLSDAISHSEAVAKEWTETFGTMRIPVTESLVRAAIKIAEANEDATVESFANDIDSAMTEALHNLNSIQIGDTLYEIVHTPAETQDGNDTWSLRYTEKSPEGTSVGQTTVVPAASKADAVNAFRNIRSAKQKFFDAIRANADAIKRGADLTRKNIYQVLSQDDAQLLTTPTIRVYNGQSRIDETLGKPMTMRLLHAAISTKYPDYNPEETWKSSLWVNNGNIWSFAIPELHVEDTASPDALEAIVNGEAPTFGELLYAHPIINIYNQLATVQIPLSTTDADAGGMRLTPLNSFEFREAVKNGNWDYVNAELLNSVTQAIEYIEGAARGDFSPSGNTVEVFGQQCHVIATMNNIELNSYLYRILNVYESKFDPIEYLARLVAEVETAEDEETIAIIGKILNESVQKASQNPTIQGYINAAPDYGVAHNYNMVIRLFQQADNTTLIHELGHWMWRLMESYSKNENAPQSLKHSVASINAWLDAEVNRKYNGADGEAREYLRHEVFADGFSAFLRTSEELDERHNVLFPVHNALVNTYNALRVTPDVQITPEVSEIFNTYLAGQEAFNANDLFPGLQHENFHLLMQEYGLLDVNQGTLEKILSLLKTADNKRIKMYADEIRKRIDAITPELEEQADDMLRNDHNIRVLEAVFRAGGIPIELVELGDERAALYDYSDGRIKRTQDFDSIYSKEELKALAKAKKAAYNEWKKYAKAHPKPTTKEVKDQIELLRLAWHDAVSKENDAIQLQKQHLYMQMNDQVDKVLKAVKAELGASYTPTFEQIVAIVANTDDYYTARKKLINRLKESAIASESRNENMAMLVSPETTEVLTELMSVLNTLVPNQLSSSASNMMINAKIRNELGNTTVRDIMNGNIKGEKIATVMKKQSETAALSLIKALEMYNKYGGDATATRKAMESTAEGIQAFENLRENILVMQRFGDATKTVNTVIRDIRNIGKKMKPRMMADGYNALLELAKATINGQVHHKNGLVSNKHLNATAPAPYHEQEQGSKDNFRKSFVRKFEMDSIAVGLAAHVWNEKFYADTVDISTMTLVELEEFRDFIAFIKQNALNERKTEGKNKWLDRFITASRIVTEINGINPDATPFKDIAVDNGKHAKGINATIRQTLAALKLPYRMMEEAGTEMRNLCQRIDEMLTLEGQYKQEFIGNDQTNGLKNLLNRLQELRDDSAIAALNAESSPVKFREQTTSGHSTHSAWDFNMACYATLMMGSDSGRQRLRLTIGDDTISDEDLLEIPKALSPEALHIINDIWGLLEGLNSHVRHTYRMSQGYDLRPITTTQFMVNGINMTGGYAPIMYAEGTRAIYTVATTGNALENNPVNEQGGIHTDRKGVKMADVQSIHDRKDVQLEVGASIMNMLLLERYCGDAAHYAAFGIDMPRILAILEATEVRKAYGKKFGFEQYNEMIKKLRVLANPANDTAAKQSLAESYARSMLVIGALGLNFKSVLKQIPGLFIGAQDIGAKHMISAIQQFTAHPLETMRKIHGISNLMLNRAHEVDNDLRGYVSALSDTSFQKGYTKVMGWMTAPLRYMDSVIAGIQFLGMYEKCIEEGMTAQQSLAIAESHVRRTQGDTNKFYQIGMRDSHLARWATMFMTAATAQLQYGLHKITAHKRGEISTGEMLLGLTFSWFLPAFTTALIAYLFAYDNDDDDDIDVKTNTAMKEFVSSFFSGIPVVRDAADSLAYRMFPTGKNRSAGAWFSSTFPVLDPAGKLANSTEKAYKAMATGNYGVASLNLLDAIGIATRIPIYTGSMNTLKALRVFTTGDIDEGIANIIEWRNVENQKVSREYNKQED